MFTCFSLFITFKAKFYLQQVLSEYVFNGYSDVMGKVYPWNSYPDVCFDAVEVPHQSICAISVSVGQLALRFAMIAAFFLGQISQPL